MHSEYVYIHHYIELHSNCIGKYASVTIHKGMHCSNVRSGVLKATASCINLLVCYE